VYGTVLPVSGLLQNAELQRSWMTRLVRPPSALYQRVTRASRTALSWMTNASGPEPQTSSGWGSATLTSCWDPVQIVPAPSGLPTRKSGGGGLSSSGAGGAWAWAAAALAPSTTTSNAPRTASNPLVRRRLVALPPCVIPARSRVRVGSAVASGQPGSVWLAAQAPRWRPGGPPPCTCRSTPLRHTGHNPPTAVTRPQSQRPPSTASVRRDSAGVGNGPD